MIRYSNVKVLLGFRELKRTFYSTCSVTRNVFEGTLEEVYVGDPTHINFSIKVYCRKGGRGEPGNLARWASERE